MNSFKVLLRRLSLVCLCMEPAWAEFVGPPAGAAGVVEKEIQREYSVEEMSPDKEVPLLEIDIPQKTLHVPLGKPVFIQSIQIEGNSLFGTQVLEKIWGSYLGKELTGQDVQEVCRQVQQFYVEQGYILARVYPPVQEIQNNTLTIKVLEGVLSQISIEGNQFYKEWYIRQYFSKLEGKPVNYHSLMKALLLVNENTDLGVGAVFTKGAEVGLVHLVLMVKDSRPIHIYGDYNNWGSNITTYSRVGARLDIGNAATSGDKLSVIGVGGIPFKDLDYVNAIYSMPLNGYGTRLDLSYLYSHFDVQQDLQADLAGFSQVGGFVLRQPIHRSRRFASDVVVSFDVKQLKNTVQDQTGSYDKLRVLGIGGKFDLIDSAKGRNLIDLTVYAGIPDFLGGSGVVSTLPSRAGAGNRMFILHVDYRRIQALPLDCLCLLNASAQGTFNLLPLSEQIYIGGIGTVRGYPLSVALGDTGYYGTLEFHAPPPFLRNKMIKCLHKQWKDFLQFVAFLDHGGVYNNDKVPSEKPVYLTAVGTGLRLYGPWNLNVSLDVGFPLTHPDKLFSSIFYLKVSMGI